MATPSSILVGLAIFFGVVYLIFWISPRIERFRGMSRKCPYGAKKTDLPSNTQYSTTNFPTRVSAKTSAKDKQKIPRVIVQTNERDDIPVGMAENIADFLQKNPEYDYIYFDDLRARSFIQTNYSPRVLKAYDTLVPGAYKADLFRYCYLFKNGGVYVDTGMMAVGTLSQLLKPDDVFVSPEDNGQGGVYNAFMASLPGSPIVGKAIELSVKNIEDERYFYGYVHAGLRITGPLLLSVAFEEAMTKLRGRKIKVVAGKDYGGGVRLLKFYSNNIDGCSSGEIFLQGSEDPILFTKYPAYHREVKKYNTNPHYSELWKKRGVYRKN